MVTKKEQEDIKVKPRDAIALVVMSLMVALLIGLGADWMKDHPRDRALRPETRATDVITPIAQDQNR